MALYNEITQVSEHFRSMSSINTINLAVLYCK